MPQLVADAIPPDPMALLLGLGLATVLVALPLVFYFTKWKARAKQNLRELADRLGFAPNADMQISFIPRVWAVPQHGMPSEFQVVLKPTETGIEGKIGGKRFRFAQFYSQKPAGDEIFPWADVSVAVRAEGFRFVLVSRHPEDKFMGWFGGVETAVGDAEFERHWHVLCSHPAILKTMLLPELREKITRLAWRSNVNCALVFEEFWLRYQEMGDFTTRGQVVRYEGMTGLLADLADALEIAVPKAKHAENSSNLGDSLADGQE